jgi:hypothetical protein
MAERAYNSGDAIVVVRRPVKIPFDTEYDIADLVIESGLAAAHKNGVIISVAEVQAEEAVRYCGIGPSSADVAADVKGAPWRDLPQAFGPYTTCYNRVVR